MRQSPQPGAAPRPTGRQSRHRWAPGALATLLAASCVAVLPAQFPPDSFTNLQVLPKTIGQRDLLSRMRGFTFALGVRCPFCHVGTEGAPLDSFDFASDDKRTKQTARLMLRMVEAINGEQLSRIPERPDAAVEVRCVTCHRGLARPLLVEDTLRAALAEGGGAGAVAVYQKLRAEFYGSGSYDFSEETLNEFGAGLIREGRAPDAVSLLELSAGLHPASPVPHFYLGEAFRVQRDTARAVASYRRSLEIDPDQPLVRRLLERLVAPP